jgi:hypothetical protein
MAMTKWVYAPAHPEANRNGFVVAEAYYPWKYGHVVSGAPNVISDIMPATRHMADGKLYDSKRKFRETTKAHGCIEIGSETKYLVEPRKQVPLSREQRREDIRLAIFELRNGRST